MESPEKLGARIRAARKGALLSPERLAALCNTSRSTIFRWENGEVEPTVGNIRALCEVLGVTPDALLWGAGSAMGDGSLPQWTRSKAKTPRLIEPANGQIFPMRMHRLPVVSRAAADHVPNFSESKEFAEVDVKFSAAKNYCVQVKGNSMRPNILEGDICVVEHVDLFLDVFDPERGPADKALWRKLHKHVVFAVVDEDDGHPYLKRALVSDRKDEKRFKIDLVGDNAASERIEITGDRSLRVIGIVRSVMRDPANVL